MSFIGLSGSSGLPKGVDGPLKPSGEVGVNCLWLNRKRRYHVLLLLYQRFSWLQK